MLRACIALIALVSTLAADTLPRQIADDAFWRMVSDFSEDSGYFRFEFMSNERQFQTVIPELKKITTPGGAYVGVGPEQNFTYNTGGNQRSRQLFEGNFIQLLCSMSDLIRSFNAGSIQTYEQVIELSR